MTTENSLSVAIVGRGFGERVILPCLSAVDGLAVTAFVSRDPASSKCRDSCGDELLWFPSIDDLCQSMSCDLVCIATPPFLHEEAVILALEYRVNVLCEKPLSSTLDGAKRMADAADASGCLALVDHQLRFHPDIVRIKKMLEEGVIGTIFEVELSYRTATRFDPNDPKWNWWSQLDQGGGQLFALGSHMIDLMQWWFGRIHSVKSTLSTVHKSRPDHNNVPKSVTSDDSAFLQVEFTEGFPAILSLSSVDIEEPMMQLRIVGSEGCIKFDWHTGLFRIDARGTTHVETQKEPLVGCKIIGENMWRTSLVNQGNEIVRAIRCGKARDVATFKDAVETQKILHAAGKSAASGRVEYPEE